MVTAAGSSFDEGSALPALVFALALLFLPGVAIGAALRLRGVVLWGAAPALTLGTVGAAAIGYARVGIAWTPLHVAGGVLVAAGGLFAASAAVAAVRRRVRGRDGGDSEGGSAGGSAYRRGGAQAPRWNRRQCGIVAAAAAASSAVYMATVGAATRGFHAIPQGWDSLLHGEVIRWIANTGSASPFELAGAAHPGDAHYYYPDAFHALGALVLQMPGGGMPLAYNALLAVTGPAFVAGGVALARRIDPRPVTAVAAALLSTAVGTFPVLTIAWGPLSPFALSVALIPAAAALLTALLATPGPRVAAALGIAFSGMYVTHPSGALSGALVLALIGCAWLWRGARTRWRARGGTVPGGLPGRGFAGTAAALAGAGVVAAVVTFPSVDLAAAGTMEAFDWPATETGWQAVRSVVSFPLGGHAQWALTVLLAAGMAASVRCARLRPFAAAALLFAALYVVTSSSDADWVQTATALWWNDRNRFLALVAVVSVPILAVGLVSAAGWVRVVGARLVRRPDRRRAGVGAASVAVVLLAVVSAAVWAPRFTGVLTGRMYADGPAVTPGEVAAYEWLAARAGGDRTGGTDPCAAAPGPSAAGGGTVMNDPFDGSPWLYTLESVRIVMPGTLGDDPDAAMGPDRMALYSDMHAYGSSPVVDDAVRRCDVRWVLVGAGRVSGREGPPGFTELDANPLLRVVYQTPAATIYRVVRPGERLSSGA